MVKLSSDRPTLFSWRVVVAPLLAIVALVCWGLSSPVGASPDDDYHLSSIWCAAGEQDERCEANTSTSWNVPEDIKDSAVCYAFNPNESAACQGEGFGSPPHSLVETDRGNFEGQYPPVFYSTMGALVGPDVNASVITMRLANAVLFVGMVLLVFFALPSHRRATLLLGILISFVPLGSFFVPSVNPSSWAYTSAAVLLVSLVGFFETQGRQALVLGVLSVVAAVIGAGARADSAVYSGIAVATAVVLMANRTRSFILKLWLPLVICGVAVGFYLSAAQTEVLSGWDTGAAEVDKKRLTYDNLLNVPDLLAGAFGKWGLGWIDTVMPASVWVTGLGIFFAVAFTGLQQTTMRKAIAVMFVLVTLWIIPTYILVQSEVSVGAAVQPRYLWPLMTVLGMAALLRVRSHPLSSSWAQRVALLTGVAAMNAVALHVNMRRYITGIDHGGLNLDAGAEWWWDIPIGPTFIWAIGSVAFAALAAVILSAREPESRAASEKQHLQTV